jgi:hypothetical protein
MNSLQKSDYRDITLNPNSYIPVYIIPLKIIKIFSPYRAVNTHIFGYKNQPFNAVYREIIAVCSEIRTENKNIIFGQK